MLTPQEEHALRQLVRDNTPMPVVNPPVSGPPTSGPNPLREMLERVTCAMPAVAGRSANGDFPEDDPELLRRTAHVQLKNRAVNSRGDRVPETMSQFHARTGLSRDQILKMSKAEITAFVEQSEKNAVEDVRSPAFGYSIEPVAPQPQVRPGVAALVG